MTTELLQSQEWNLILSGVCLGHLHQDKLSLGRRTFHATFAFDDRSEGMAAFAEKRKASWKHR